VAIGLHEDHDHWLDGRPAEAVRPLVLAAGRPWPPIPDGALIDVDADAGVVRILG